jgi:hypothetical protein
MVARPNPAKLPIEAVAVNEHAPEALLKGLVPCASLKKRRNFALCNMDSSRLQAAHKQEKISNVQIYWTTITYKTVAIYLCLLFAILMGTLYLIYPDWVVATVHRVSTAISGGSASVAQVTQNQAKFVNLDGKVMVKKANSVEWVAADYRTALDRGDLIQTGPDGAARLTFIDGTTYTVKADTLVTVEQNAVDPDRATRVGVHISSGAVDLATGTWNSPKSKAEVSFADAVASLNQNSRAAVRSDPGTNEHDITMASGSAEVRTRNGDQEQKVEINRYERASVSPGGSIVKSNVLAPPDLTEPVNLQPIIVSDPKHATIRFEWKNVPEAVSYELRVSSTAMFANVLADKHVTGDSAEVTGLDAGEYFWNVIATDANKRASEPSDTYKFSLVTQGKSEEMLLEVDSTQINGRVVEISGRTEPGAALIVNGQSVAGIQADGHFRYFTDPLARGSHTIVITGQNRRGGTAIKRVPIVIP